MTRLTVWGSGYLILVCLMPRFLIVSANVPLFGRNLIVNMRRRGYGLYAQVQSHLMSHQYESLLKKLTQKDMAEIH